MAQRKEAFQDGADFYAEDGSGRIVSYPGLLKDDFDMHGSAKARAKFADEYGDKYYLAEDAA